MRKLKYLPKPVLAAIVSLFVISAPVFAQDEEQPKRTMFTNVNVWDGSSDSLDMNSNVLVENNKVVSIGSSITLPEGADVIDGGGRTLMPGLIDMHTHTGLRRGVPDHESMWDGQATGAMAHETMTQYLHMGYTAMRDICAGSLGVARAENAGVLSGPRMYSGGACIGATSGHSDWAVVTNNGQSNHQKI